MNLSMDFNPLFSMDLEIILSNTISICSTNIEEAKTFFNNLVKDGNRDFSKKHILEYNYVFCILKAVRNNAKFFSIKNSDNILKLSFVFSSLKDFNDFSFYVNKLKSNS